MCNHKRNEKVANRFGRCFYRRMEKFKLEDLKPGDHIVVQRHKIYYHHMIVERVELKLGQIIVIHYYSKTAPSGFGSTVCRTSFEYTPE